MIDDVKDYAWKNRTSVSALVREILEEYLADPRLFKGVSDVDEQVPAVLTLYVPSDIWFEARDLAYVNGRMPLSVVIRKGLLTRLAASAA